MDTDRSTTTSINVAAAILAAIVTTAMIFALGRASGSVQQHGLLIAGATAGALPGLWFGLRHAPALRAWSIGGVVVTLAVALALGGLLSRPSEVREQVIVADVDGQARASADQNVLLARGDLEPLAHKGEGTASLIRAADGRHVLTLTDFTTDAGPDLEVWLVAGNPDTDSDVEDGTHVSLGRLKGTSGDQQYVLPADVDPAEFTHAYVWCRAFSVGFSRARLA